MYYQKLKVIFRRILILNLLQIWIINISGKRHKKCNGQKARRIKSISKFIPGKLKVKVKIKLMIIKIG